MRTAVVPLSLQRLAWDRGLTITMRPLSFGWRVELIGPMGTVVASEKADELPDALRAVEIARKAATR